MKKYLASLAIFALATAARAESVCSASTSTGVAVDTRTSIADSMLIQYSTLDAGECTVSLDGTAFIKSPSSGSFRWQPQSKGNHTLTLTAGSTTWNHTVNVTGYDFFVQPAANPPMSKNTAIAITPTTRSFELGGGAGAINTSGSGTWTAAVSDSWISLNSTSGTAGNPVVYMVDSNPGVEPRTGYVYVSGYTHTITQAGYGATVSPTSAEFEHQGGNGSVTVSAQGQLGWHARPNCNWISVSPTSGSGEAVVNYQVAPWDEVSTRSGTMTIAGETVTVFQYGRRMKLSENSTTCDYHTHAIAITVNALAITHWSVTPNKSWISVVDAGNGVGGDTVGLAVAENPSYLQRVGTVTIGTETYTITQQGRTALEFAISPTSSTASRDGANGLIAVTATPDLPWTAAFNANWCTILPTFASGAGNGSVAYTVSPNSTLNNRTATLTVTPGDQSLLPRTHTVTQPAAVSALSSTGYEFEAAGEAASVDVAVASIVEWQISNVPGWITVSGSSSRVGPSTVTLTAAANDTVYPRSGTITIARKSFTVTQKARGVEVEYDTKLFGTDGGFGEIDIHPDGNISWTAVSSDTSWLTVYGGGSGTGNGTILYVVSPYVGTGEPRNGTITVGDKVIYITQRSYDLTIDPYGEWVTGNSGAGEVGVSAGIHDVWNAIVTEPWITIITGYDSGTGSGTVYFTYTENNTGKTRTGKIVIAGEVYTLTQAARTLVSIGTSAGNGGSVSGGGSYVLGTGVTLTAVPDAGYKFLYWTLPDDSESMVNPLSVTADVAKNYSAVFAPLTPELISADSSTEGVMLVWTNLAWATQYKIYRGEAMVPSLASVVATLSGNGMPEYLDQSGELDVTYWYWVEAIGANDTTISEVPLSGKRRKPIVISPITYTNLRGATHSNPSTYEEETSFAFTNPSAVEGYTFNGWSPSGITADMTGAVTVSALWSANTYTITYNANGGSGTMAPTAAVYDSSVTLAANGFERANYAFQGWATEANGSVVYAAGANVQNLTAVSHGVVVLYAVWQLTGVPAPVITPADGTVFTEDTCTVTLTCDADGASIYFTTNGATPKTSSSYLYSGPFAISGTVSIKAVAMKDNVKSAYSTATITKVALTLENALDVPEGVTITTGGDADWAPIADDISKTGGMCAESGLIGDEEESWLQLAVSGAGTLSFWCRTSCEHDDDNTFTWDCLYVLVDGVEDYSMRMDGETGWTQRTVTFQTAGAHTVKIYYSKDESDYDGEDCVWVDTVVWTPSQATVTETQTTSTPIPFSWLEGFNLASGGSANAAAYESAAKALAANGKNTVEECFIAGLDPTDATKVFRTLISIVNGQPVISWDPELTPEEAAKRTYTIFGKTNLTDQWVPKATGHRFFKVDVGMK